MATTSKVKMRKLAGVDPYQGGRETATEWIEGGEQREEVDCGQTKAQAIDAGRALLRRMGHGWTLRVWQNLGWHYSLQRGPLSLYAHKNANERASYSCLLADDPKESGHGCVAWSPIDRGRPTPEAAVRLQLKLAQAVVNRMQAAIKAAS